ncbi:exodeoxyribonuclease VII small subunit [Thauera sp. CAU 1555]|jgi:exodeoxyribonuclease VII small subunit|uniref:Exodeoxyribonuclease 7 small subunit n=1 Tax=Thauera sedimentorum TaxID=2767595 RepID=A0ABR9BFT4_9RHOO|nr:exodeoxyribonuclease VII small subunit [Thauera sedimentorum]MBC9073944.1 exodeoxyribonuclease VII small subunit [Thauera sedimentorum]MBD8504863.1 exodeoxyribonuclease VII small subunit [Thauera sedimentorum]
MARAAPAPENFESAVSELEAIVRDMESGELPLEQALERYQRGVGLLKFCQKTLARAEDRIRILEADTLQPMAPADDSST